MTDPDDLARDLHYLGVPGDLRGYARELVRRGWSKQPLTAPLGPMELSSVPRPAELTVTVIDPMSNAVTTVAERPPGGAVLRPHRGALIDRRR